MKILCIITVLALSGTPALAQRSLRDIPPPDPEVEKASFKVADGFEVNLWAADPLLAKPTQISFDRDGRLWVSSSETYPQLNVNQNPNDRILVLEDSDGDGSADRSSIFYDKLIIPGGVLPDGSGGAYVAHAEELIHLTDSDGDGVADQEEVLLAGFGTEDTHHTLHRLRWGPDGLLYMLQGYYIGTHVETLYGPRRLNGGGLWTYDTRSRRLEIYSRGLVNPWGMTFNRWGQTFQTDGAGGQGINYSFPDSVFLASPHENRTLKGLNPGRPKLCGIEIISGSHFPEEWQGRLLANDFRANNIDSYALEESESGFLSTLQDDLLQSTHVSFRPIDVVMGPDGAVYVADWYSPIIQHGEVDFRDERRDQVHGRIWRITAKGQPLVKKVDYRNLSIPHLLDLLKVDEDWIRLNAKQELKERDANAVHDAIGNWMAALDSNNPRTHRYGLEALWALQTTSPRRELGIVEVLFDAPDHRVRAGAIRVLYHWRDGIDLLQRAVQDPHPLVRREAVSALGQLNTAEAAGVALRALDHPLDQYLDFALWRTCRLLKASWLTAFKNGERMFDGNADHLAFALKAIEEPEALAPLVAMLKVSSQDADPAVVRLIGKIGSAEDLDPLLTIAETKGHPLAPHAGLALVEAIEDRGISPNDESRQITAVESLLQNNETHGTAFRLIGGWKLNKMTERLLDFLAPSPPSDHHAEAAAALATLGQTEALLRLGSDDSIDRAVRISAVVALLRVSPERAAPIAGRLLTEPLTGLAIDQLISAGLSHKAGAGALAEALTGKTIPETTAVQATRLVEVSGTVFPEFTAALEKAGSLKPLPPKLTNDQIEALIAKLNHADPSRGKAIYQRTALACSVCHVVNGNGGVIGPDLTSIGASAPVDYLIKSILDPSDKIKEGYRMTVVTSKNGDITSGTIVHEDQNVIVVRNPIGNRIRVPRSSIESRITSPVSMMPSGLTASLREDEFLDLVSYLALLGKQERSAAPGQYPNGKEPERR